MLSTKVKIAILAGAGAAIAAGSAGYWALTGGVEQITLTGPSSSPSAVVVSTTSPTPVPSPRPSASPPPRSPRQELRILVLASEAEVLGITPRHLAADYREGTTLSQLAARRKLSRTPFQDAFCRDLDSDLVGAVGHGLITQQQASRAEAGYRTRLPHWTAPTPGSKVAPKPVRG